MALPANLNRRHAVVTALPGEHPSHLSHNLEIVAPTLDSHRDLPVVNPDQRMSQRAVVTALQCVLLNHHQDHPVQAVVITALGARLVGMRDPHLLSVEIDHLTGHRVQVRHRNGIMDHALIPVVEATGKCQRSKGMVVHHVEVNRRPVPETPDVHKDRIETNRHSRLAHKPAGTSTGDALPCQRAVSTVMNGAVRHASRLQTGPERPGRQTAG